MIQRRDAISKHNKRGALRAGLLALLFHVGLIALLFVGVRWNTKDAEPVQIEIFTPPSAPSKTVEVEPEPAPKPVPKIEPKEEPKVEIKPDIALEKKKLEKEKALALKQTAALEKQNLDKQILDKQKLDAQKSDSAAKAAKAAKAEAAAKDAAKESDENIKKLVADQQRQAGAQTGAQAGAKTGVADPNYAGRVKSAVVRNTVFRSDDVVGSPAADFRVTLTPDCAVRDVKLIKPSGNSAWDQAAERAIRKTDPFPTPADGKCPPYQDLTHRPTGAP